MRYVACRPQQVQEVILQLCMDLSQGGMKLLGDKITCILIKQCNAKNFLSVKFGRENFDELKAICQIRQIFHQLKLLGYTV